MEQLSLLGNLMMWLVPPTIFMAYAGYAIISGKFNFGTEGEGMWGEQCSWGRGPMLASVLLPFLSVFVMYGITDVTIDFLSKDTWGAILGYVAFESIGGWIMFLIFYASLRDGTFEYLSKKTNQAKIFGIDPETLEIGSYVIRQKNNEYYKKTSWSAGVQPALFRVAYGKDLAGSHKYFLLVHSFNADDKQNWTRDRLIDELKGYFDNEKVFTLDGKGVIVETQKKDPEVLVIPQGD